MKFEIALAQYPILFHSSEELWKKAVQTFANEAKSSQLLVFPEYGSMDLTSLLSEQDRKLSKQIHSIQKFVPLFLDCFSEIAKRNNQFVLAPSIPIVENNKSINRAYFFGPNGLIGYQDKQKMTRFENEDWIVSPGKNELEVFETDLGKIGINICYDIEFPKHAAEISKKGAHILLAPSCTETMHGLSRVHVGARARALENQFYVGVAQTVGEALWSPAVDINTGQAILCGPPDLGFPVDGIIATGVLNQPGWVKSEIDLSLVENVRRNGAVFNWKDGLS